jgi:hypothetical protein
VKIIFLLYIILFIPLLSGCALLVFPASGIIAHTIQKSNEDYDNIIVNMGYRYKQYYQEMEERSKEREVQGKPMEQILTFEQWMDIQAKNDKESKAVERYKRIHVSNP